MVCMGLLCCLNLSNTAGAQNSSFEFWPETDIWCRLTPSWRLSAFTPITIYNESKYRPGPETKLKVLNNYSMISHLRTNFD